MVRDVEKKFKQKLHLFLYLQICVKIIIGLRIAAGGNLKSMDFLIIIFT